MLMRTHRKGNCTHNNTAILLLGCTPKEKGHKAQPHCKTLVFSRVKSWKQPIYLSTQEWIEKMQYIYTVNFYSTIRKNSFMSFTEKSMEMMLSDDIKQNQKRNIKFLQYKIQVVSIFKKTV